MEFQNIVTPRLMIRIPTSKDTRPMHEALCESFETLKKWMPWAQILASIDDVEVYLKAHELAWMGNWQARVEAPLQIVDRASKKFIGATGIKPKELSIPSFEIGYWIRDGGSGNGLMTEAINGLSRYLFQVMGAKRLELGMDVLNKKSIGVAKRLNFTQEAHLHNHRLSTDGSQISDTLVFACTEIDVLPELVVHWYTLRR